MLEIVFGFALGMIVFGAFLVWDGWRASRKVSRS